MRVATRLYCVCLAPCRTPESDSTNPWGSIEPRLRTTGLSPFQTEAQSLAENWCSFSFLAKPVFRLYEQSVHTHIHILHTHTHTNKRKHTHTQTHTPCHKGKS